MPHPTLYSPRNQPIQAATWDFYENSSTWNRSGDTTTLTYTSGAQDSDKLLPSSNWEQLLSSSRFLFANVPILRGAILEQASLSFPLEAQYRGKDKEWGRRAEEWLWEWRKIASNVGPTYDDWTIARCRLIGRRVDGHIATLLTSTDGGYPKIQLIRAHRIGNRYHVDPLEKGPYKGNRISNGVVYNRYGTVLAYHVLGESSDGAEDEFVSANNMFLSFRPDYPDLKYGIPELCACIGSFNDIKRLREYEMRAQQLGAAIGLIEKNETGTEDESSLAVVRRADPSTAKAGSVGPLTTRTFEQGMVNYYKANSGAGLEPFRQDRPSADAQAFEDKIVRGAMYGIEWDADFALALKEPGGAWARTVIEKIRRCIQNNQRIEAAARRREDGYAIAKAIKLGLLPKPSDGDWFSWEYTGPARITADSGNEERAKQDNYKLGSLTLEAWSAERGEWWIDVRGQKQTEAVDLLTRAQQLKKQFQDLSLQECINLLEQRTPNGATGQPKAPAEPQPGQAQ